MNTKLLMSVSAVVLGTIGLLLSFLPYEILQYAGVNSVSFLPVILQMLGAIYLGFAILNWMARGNLIGGVYSRPVAIGNLMHFIVGGLALLKAAYAGPGSPALWAVGALYAGFAILYAKVTFTHPIKETPTKQAA